MLSASPGLRSRFPYQLEFVSNTLDEIVEIAQLFARNSPFTINPDALEHCSRVAEWLCSTSAPAQRAALNQNPYKSSLYGSRGLPHLGHQFVSWAYGTPTRREPHPR